MSKHTDSQQWEELPTFALVARECAWPALSCDFWNLICLELEGCASVRPDPECHIV